MKSEDIWNKPLTEAQLKVLRRHAERQAVGDDSQIDFSDIPALTADQLARVARLRDRPPKVAVSVRLDRSVLEWLKSKGDGHLTDQRYSGEYYGDGDETLATLIRETGG